VPVLQEGSPERIAPYVAEIEVVEIFERAGKRHVKGELGGAGVGRLAGVEGAKEGAATVGVEEERRELEAIS
jgi:hypothetical protein